ncbi:MAG: SDR family oxidoreductase [Actinomycetota bacterium]|nr:SDR family oxidoreductase [Actinomycetota bacterium]
MSGYDSGFRPGLFAEKTIVVTGGGSGLGRCIAHELASLGGLVVLVGRTDAKLDRVRAEIEADGGRTRTRTCDIRDEAGVIAAVGGIVDELGPIDGLVNNAGGQFPAPLRDLSLNGWNAVVANNMTGTFLVSREVYRQSMEAHGGAIVNVGADHDPAMPGMGHNGAARAGQANFTATASVEWAHAGVRVNHVTPGYIATSGLDTYPPEQHETLRRVARRVPLKRHGTEAELSAAVVFLLSPMAAYITGASLRVDGGLHNNIGGFVRLPDHSDAPRWDGFHRSEPPAVLAGADPPPRESDR